MMRIQALAITFLLGITFVEAATVGEFNDFETSVDNWVHPIENPFVPIISADSGANGGNALLIRAGGTGRAGSRLLAINQDQWTGSFAGIRSIHADIANTSSIRLTIRLGFDGDGGRFVSEGVTIDPGTDYQKMVFDLQPETLRSVGGDDAAATLANTSQMRILHNAAEDYRGARVEAEFLVDNLLALPEVTAGDFDLDGDVDSADVTILVTNWTGAQTSSLGKTYLQGDADADGDVDGADRTAQVTNWTGAQAEAVTNVVPEPSTKMLMLVAVAGALFLRRFLARS